MVPDLMHQNMGHDMAQCLIVFSPVVKDGPSIEEDHIGKLTRDATSGFFGQSDALKETHEFKGVFYIHVVKDFIAGKVLDSDNEVATQGTELRRQELKASAAILSISARSGLRSVA